MQLRKTTENINRYFDKEGQQSDRIENRRYDILDNDAASTYANISFHLNGFDNIEAAEQRIREILTEGIED